MTQEVKQFHALVEFVTAVQSCTQQTGKGLDRTNMVIDTCMLTLSSAVATHQVQLPCTH